MGDIGDVCFIIAKYGVLSRSNQAQLNWISNFNHGQRKKEVKQRICSSWIEGKCQWGGTCRFKHSHKKDFGGRNNRQTVIKQGYGKATYSVRHTRKRSRAPRDLGKISDTKVLRKNEASLPYLEENQKKCPNALSKSYRTDNKGIQEEDVRLWNWCKKSLKEIRNKPEAKSFLEPVDWVKLKIPNYPNIIKNPMDIKSIEDKIDHRAYSNIFKI